MAYLVDIFDSSNTLNLKMQGKEKKIIQFVDLINAFVVKLSNWRRKVQKGNLAMFRNLADISELDEALKTDVAQHLENWKANSNHSFLKLLQMTYPLQEIRFGFPLRK